MFYSGGNLRLWQCAHLQLQGELPWNKAWQVRRQRDNQDSIVRADVSQLTSRLQWQMYGRG